jgi:hypothetical protein
MTTCFLAPDPIQGTFFIPGGAVPGNGVQVFFYVAGSSTKQTVYKDGTASVSWTNPIVLDSGGNLPSGGEVWFVSGQTYKVIWAPSTDTDPPGSPYRTMDNLSGTNDVSAQTGSEWVGSSTAPAFIAAGSFSLPGDQRALYQVNRRTKSVNTGGTIYSTITSSALASGSTNVGVVSDSGTLDSGLSAVSYGLLSATNPSFPTLVQRATTVTTFTFVGSTVTYSPRSPNIVAVEVELVGGGGAGGGATSTGANQFSAGSGGQSGGYARNILAYSQISSGISVTVGAGGSASSGTIGKNGSTTTFGTMIALGGSAGSIVSPVTAIIGLQLGSAAPITTSSGTGGIVNIPGGFGGNSVGASTAGSGLQVISGYGGSSQFGCGGTYVFGSGAIQTSSGAAGNAYGGGGSGGANTNNSPAVAGGPGASGVCVVIEFY